MASFSLPALIDGLGPKPADLPPPAQWTEFGRDRQAAFLEALATGGSVRAAARSVDVSYRTAYRARRGDPAFRLAWSGALLAGRAQAEDVLACRAIDGVEEEVWYHGEVVATRRRYDGRLLLAHLGRLDRLTEDVRASAFADDFEAALARFAAGEDEPANAPQPPADNSSPEQCDNRDKSNSAPGGGPNLEWCEHTGQMLPKVDRLTNAMEATRPADAPALCELPCGGRSYGDIEAEQMAAFEQGVPRWWLVVPPGPDDDPRAWCYCEPDPDDEGWDEEEG